MSKTTVTIEQEKVLLKYLYSMLEEGITTGITEKEYFKFINILVDKINSESKNSEYIIPTIINKESFSEIAQKLSTTLTKDNGKQGILYKETNNGGIILPTYDLEKSRYKDCSIENINHRILDDLLKSIIKKPKLSSYPLENTSKENLENATKIAAVYVNEVIRRYVTSRIENNRWPAQCSDIDQYIFQKDIAKYIDEQGTIHNLKQAYIQAIRVVCELQDKSTTDDIIKFSNNKNNFLAYANYIKFFTPEELSFLKEFSHNKYILNDASIDLCIDEDQVKYKTSTPILLESYGKGYKNNEGIVDNTPGKVMKKRLLV